MKRLILLFTLLVASVSAFAYEGYGTCKIPGTDSYLEGTAYISNSGSHLSGNLVITNGHSKPLQSASIKVIVNYEWKTSHTSPYDGGKVVNKGRKSLTLYDSRWTGNIAGYQSGKVDLSGTLSLPEGAYDIKIDSIDVSINNPYCN
ncbi:MAG: hypothetical protein K2M93_02520 [Muribaculaceae bacterium]|nr:hypothetical protein [Muribaculaceae bacterium]